MLSDLNFKYKFSTLFAVSVETKEFFSYFFIHIIMLIFLILLATFLIIFFYKFIFVYNVIQKKKYIKIIIKKAINNLINCLYSFNLTKNIAIILFNPKLYRLYTLIGVSLRILLFIYLWKSITSMFLLLPLINFIFYLGLISLRKDFYLNVFLLDFIMEIFDFNPQYRGLLVWKLELTILKIKIRYLYLLLVFYLVLFILQVIVEFVPWITLYNK